MRIEKVSSSLATFREVHFRNGLNLVLGNKSAGVDSTNGHNVGKSSLIKIIEYTLFIKRDKKYFEPWLRKFPNQEFRLKIKYNNAIEVLNVPISPKVTIKDPIHQEIKNISTELGYLIRYKSEFDDEFTRPNSLKGKHINWKPFIFGLLGFDAEKMRRKMALDIEYDKVSTVLTAIETADQKDVDKTEIISRLTLESQDVREAMSKFDFFHYEKEMFSNRLSRLNKEYNSIKKRVIELEEKYSSAERSLRSHSDLKFDIDEINRIYSESGILLANGVTKSFEELVKFNQEITISRKAMLENVMVATETELTRLYEAAKQISGLRAKYYNILLRKDYKEEFDALQGRLIEIEKEISVLSVSVFKKSKEEFILRKNDLELEVAESKIELRNEKESPNPSFEKLKQYYSMLVKRVLQINANISLFENTNSNIDFKVDIQEAEAELLSLNGDAYKRISCGLFDLAFAAAYNKKQLVVAHDGILDGIAAKLKSRYIHVTHSFCLQNNLQYILSGINEGIPFSALHRCARILLSDEPESNTLFGVKF